MLYLVIDTEIQKGVFTMAAPRVFISSTYYDLKHVRNDIGDFIKTLGYTPVMHDKVGVAYTQPDTILNSCYSELTTCDIVICIIGNHFGSQSSASDFSITMEELRTAIKNKKKIYIFIAKDVYIENRTYMQNQESGAFKPAYADDIKIHQFIEELRLTVKNNPIGSFETSADIIGSLKSQFAGLFQNLLIRDASLTEAKTAYDLQETTESFKELLSSFHQETEKMFEFLDGTYFTTNNTIHYIRSLLGMKKSQFIVLNQSGLEEFLQAAGFSEDIAEPDDNYWKYTRVHHNIQETLTLDLDLFDTEQDWKLKRLPLSRVKELIQWDREDISSAQSDEELPF